MASGGRNWELSVAHLNHGTRGSESDRDQKFVEELADRLKLPVDLGFWRPPRQSHFETDARKYRYQWLTAIAQQRKSPVVAVGHTRDDQAETVLQRILRGTGPRGLAGIPSRRRLNDDVMLVRPLLGITRDEARAFLESIGQEWSEDSTNADFNQTRARIRGDLLPKLALEYNPKISEALARLGDLCRSLGTFADDHLRGLLQRATIKLSDDIIELDRTQFLEHPKVIRAELFRIAWRHAGWSEQAMDATRWSRLARAARHNRVRFSLAGGVIVESDDRVIILRKTQSDDESSSLPDPARLSIPGSVRWNSIQIRAVCESETDADEWIDYGQVVPFGDQEGGEYLIVDGKREPGERFQPLGMDGHSMPINDFLRGAGLSKELRSQVPILRDTKGIVWVVGHRIAHRVRQTAATEELLGLRVEPSG